MSERSKEAAVAEQVMPVMADAQSSPSDGLQSSDIVVLYDNDVHCAADGYAKAAAMKAEVKTKTENVALVSCGDFIQGGALGTLSKGKSIIKIMIIEGSSAVVIAAIMENSEHFRGRSVLSIISGSNVDTSRVKEILGAQGGRELFIDY